MANLIQLIIEMSGANKVIEDLKRTQVGMVALGSAAGSLIGTLAGQGLAAAAASIGEAFGSIALAGPKLAEEIQHLQNLSQRTGASIDSLRVLSRVMEEIGQSPDALTMPLQTLNIQLQRSSESLTKLVGDTKDPMEALLKLADIVAHGGNAAKTAFDAMGRSGGELSPILSTLRDRYGEVKDALAELDPQTVQSAEAWDRLMNRMGRATKNFLAGAGAAFLKFLAIARRDPTRDLFESGMAEHDLAMAERARMVAKPPPGPPNPFANFRNFPDTGAGNVQRRGVPSVMDEATWKKVFDAMNAGEPVVKKLAKAFEETNIAMEIAAESLAFNFLDAFDSIVFRGTSAAQALRDAFMSAIRDITNELLKIGVGIGLEALGFAIGGPLGGAIGRVGGRLAGAGAMSRGNTYVIQTLDSGTLRSSMQPGGTWNRAQDQVRIGSRY